ncbi:MAG: hypothetical protein ABFS34_12090 [Gemmatimonadota bacterium]
MTSSASRLALLLILAAWGVACGDDEGQLLEILAINPGSALAGGPAFTLTVRLTEGSSVLRAPVEIVFNGQSRAATITSDRVATATIQASEVVAPAVVQVGIRMDISTSMEPAFFLESDLVPFEILDLPIMEIRISPADTTVELGDTVTYAATATLSDNLTMVDVTQQVIFGTTDASVAVMDVDVARTVGVGQTAVTGAHISGIPMSPATLAVVVAPGGGNTVGFLGGSVGSDLVNVVCFDRSAGRLGTVGTVSIGSPVMDATFASAEGVIVIRTTNDVQTWRPAEPCDIELVASAPFDGLADLSEGSYSPDVGVIGYGDTGAGSKIRLFGVRADAAADELEALDPFPTGAIAGVAWTMGDAGISLVARAGTATRVATSPAQTPFSWTLGDPQNVSTDFASWGRGIAGGSFVIGSGVSIQAFDVAQADNTLSPIGSRLATEQLFRTTILGERCVYGVPQAGNSLAGWRVDGAGNISSAGARTLASFEFLDGVEASAGDELFVIGPMTGGDGVLQALIVDESCGATPAGGSVAVSGTGIFGVAMAWEFQ